MVALKRSHEWVGVVYEKHYRRLVGLARNLLVGSEVDPRDVVHDAFEAILAGNVMMGPGDVLKQLEDVVDLVAQTYREPGRWRSEWTVGLEEVEVEDRGR
jgi:hypothetical protein